MTYITFLLLYYVTLGQVNEHVQLATIRSKSDVGISRCLSTCSALTFSHQSLSSSFFPKIELTLIKSYN